MITATFLSVTNAPHFHQNRRGLPDKTIETTSNQVSTVINHPWLTGTDSVSTCMYLRSSEAYKKEIQHCAKQLITPAIAAEAIQPTNFNAALSKNRSSPRSSWILSRVQKDYNGLTSDCAGHTSKKKCLSPKQSYWCPILTWSLMKSFWLTQRTRTTCREKKIFLHRIQLSNGEKVFLESTKMTSRLQLVLLCLPVHQHRFQHGLNLICTSHATLCKKTWRDPSVMLWSWVKHFH